jgi:hypothetical protein
MTTNVKPKMTKDMTIPTTEKHVRILWPPSSSSFVMDRRVDGKVRPGE